MPSTTSEIWQKLPLGFKTKSMKTTNFRSPEKTEKDIDDLTVAENDQYIIACSISRDYLKELIQTYCQVIRIGWIEID
jgi:hypothetical protein